jgi:hypothetical protein
MIIKINALNLFNSNFLKKELSIFYWANLILRTNVFHINHYELGLNLISQTKLLNELVGFFIDCTIELSEGKFKFSGLSKLVCSYTRNLNHFS